MTLTGGSPAAGAPAVPHDGADRRLWWPALGLWAGALLGLWGALRVGPTVPVVAGGSIAVVAALAAWAGRTPRRRAVALACTR